jgi:hypothetical protein
MCCNEFGTLSANRAAVCSKVSLHCLRGRKLQSMLEAAVDAVPLFLEYRPYSLLPSFSIAFITCSNLCAQPITEH